MELSAGLIAGSHNRNELVVIRCNGESSRKPAQHLSEQTCHICGDDVGLSVDGELFVACNECAFPICKTCYEYGSREGSQACPQCKTRFKRLKGCARVVGDEEEDDMDDDFEHEFRFCITDEQQNNDQTFTEVMLKSHTSNGGLIGIGEMNILTSLVNRPMDDCMPHCGDIQPAERQHALACVLLASGSERIHPPDSTEPNLPGDEQRQENPTTKMNGEEQKDWDYASEAPDLPLRMDKAQQPLSRKIPMPSSQMNPYRTVIIIRLVVHGFFLHYRILHPVSDAYVLWLVSVMCEVWFAVSWILDQLCKWLPVDRETYLDRLSLRYEKQGQPSQLPSIDVFVCKADPAKEPPLVIANTVLSILAVDYPVDKVWCYVSDDRASMLTFETLSETSEFARKWVPFCKKFNIEPRAPEWYFSEKIDYVEEKVLPAFVKERRAMKREYEEFKVQINALVAKAENVPHEGWTMQDGTPWPGNNIQDHPAVIQVLLGQGGRQDLEGSQLPCLVYVSREKRPGFKDHKKAGAMNALVRVSAVLTNAPYVLHLDCDHYIYNSKALREAMCFMMDPLMGQKVCYVQFPQRFDLKINPEDQCATSFDINMKGLDGIQGPFYVGAGCVFRRRAIYGSKKALGRTCNCWNNFSYQKKKNYSRDESFRSPTCKLDNRAEHDQRSIMDNGAVARGGRVSLLKEAIHVLSCKYDDKTEWGKEVGWIYGSVTNDILTGFKMHCHGWRSIYCIPSRPAFKGGLKCLAHLSYINATVYPLTSIPLVIYCTLPAVCLLTEKFIIPELNNVASMWFLSLFICASVTSLLEMKWSGVSIEDWWRSEQFWVMEGVSAHFFAVFQGLLQVVVGIETEDDEPLELYSFKCITLLILPTMLLILNVIGVVVGILDVVHNEIESWGILFGKLIFACWVIVHLYPFLKGILGSQNKTPNIIVVWSILFASILSLKWIRIDPLMAKSDGYILEECGLDCN